MSGTKKKNKSDLKTLKRLLKKAQCRVKSYEEWTKLDKIDQGAVLVEVINVATKQNGKPYPNDWYPNFVNTIQRVYREDERALWRQKLLCRFVGCFFRRVKTPEDDSSESDSAADCVFSIACVSSIAIAIL